MILNKYIKFIKKSSKYFSLCVKKEKYFDQIVLNNVIEINHISININFFFINLINLINLNIYIY